jgi:hypothetical protein
MNSAGGRWSWGMGIRERVMLETSFDGWKGVGLCGEFVDRRASMNQRERP